MLFSTPFAQITNPDLGFQLSICVNSMAEQSIIQALRTVLTSPMMVGGRAVTLVPPGTPLDTRALCFSNVERVGLWFPTAPQAGRDDAMRLPSRLLMGETYVQQISLNGIRFVADRVWADPMTPKRIRLPDPFADARLTTIEISLAPPNRVVTRVNGFVPVAILGDINFSVTFTDTVALEGGLIRCMPSMPQISVGSGILRPILQAVIVPIATVALGSAGTTEGLGCRVLRAMAPGGFTVPICGRISFPYSRLDLDGNGVILGSRQPLHSCLLAARIMEEPFRGPR
ncbi:MAG TPA: hypothetical protein VNT75_11495 [Symbiobacteriaceae bacterium]|nr:hypothetical protein [Symbiobacteriaceae bacterium]